MLSNFPIGCNLEFMNWIHSEFVLPVIFATHATVDKSILLSPKLAAFLVSLSSQPVVFVFGLYFVLSSISGFHL